MSPPRSNETESTTEARCAADDGCTVADEESWCWLNAVASADAVKMASMAAVSLCDGAAVISTELLPFGVRRVAQAASDVSIGAV